MSAAELALTQFCRALSSLFSEKKGTAAVPLLEAARLARQMNDSWTDAYACGHLALLLTHLGKESEAAVQADVVARLAQARGDELLRGLAGLVDLRILSGGNQPPGFLPREQFPGHLGLSMQLEYSRMRFHGLDLNHLVTLETLLVERNLTRAAERHLLTQPAISNALTKLREYFGDELLQRNGREMERTPFAEVLLPALRSALAQLQGVAMAKPGFDPATVERTVAILTSDYVAQVFLPEVIRHFMVRAPNITISHVPMNAETISNFDAGEFDAMISPLGPLLHQHHPYKPLFLEQWICVAREGNTSVGESITVDAYYATLHVSPSYKHYIIDRSWQPPSNTAVRTAARLPFSAIPILVSETDFIAVLPERLVKKYETLLHLRRIAPIPPPPPVQFVAHWHPERSMDPFLVWTLEQLAELGSQLV